jgi:gliding motility-associated-like protein
MKKILLSALLFTVGMAAKAQLVPNGNSGSSTTAYTSGTPNDPIYIWCSDQLSTAQGSLTATPTNGAGPYTFNWFYHNQSNASWTPYTTQTGASSTVSGLASDGYRVEIRDAGNAIVDCFIAWVWNLNTEVAASSSRVNCDQANLASAVNTTGSFSYYNPPPPESLINASTQIQVCFSATHTYVSDLAFYLVGPPSCGNPTILLSPNPGANGQGSICNGGNNVSNLCFSNTTSAVLNVCTASAPLTGTYGNYGASNTPINWSSLIGCNAASGGWRVQIYDCIGADVGSLTNSSITFSNLTSLCGSPTSITYSSGAINSPINDNSCTAGTASIFQVPPDPDLTTPITINATTTTQWTSTVAINNPAILNTTASGLPTGTTAFVQTATTVYGTVSCFADDTTTISYSLPVVDAGADQTACSGASVTLSGSGAASYTWDNGVTNGAPFAPGSTTTYTVTGTDAAGCTNTDQVTVSVGTSPAVGAGPDQAICPGGSVTLTGTGAVNYSWNYGVSDGVSFTPASTQTYTVTGTDAAGCSNTDQVTVTVNQPPNISAGPDQAICPGGSVILSGSGGVSYSWTGGVLNGIAFSPAVSQTYTVTGTDANGCQNTDQATVTVHTLPNVSAGADQAMCIGGFVTLSGSGAVYYVWNNSVTDGTPFTTATTQIYTVTGTDANGCQNTDQVTVTVNQLPDVGAGSDQTVCAGTQVTLSGSGATSYSWTNGGTNGVPFTPGTGTSTYTVTGTDANGCTNTDQVTVTVVPVPVADINSTDPLSGYPGLTVNFTNGSQYGTSFDWDFDNGSTSTTTNVSDPAQGTFGSPGVYVVVLTASNGICGDTSEMTVVINPYEPLILHIPNVFTPDGDGTNDHFFIDVENGVSIEVLIMNRWGNTIAELNDFTARWDGTVNGDDADEGVYFFNYTISGKDGTSQSGHGFVELYR